MILFLYRSFLSFFLFIGCIFVNLSICLIFGSREWLAAVEERRSRLRHSAGLFSLYVRDSLMQSASSSLILCDLIQVYGNFVRTHFQNRISDIHYTQYFCYLHWSSIAFLSLSSLSVSDSLPPPRIPPTLHPRPFHPHPPHPPADLPPVSSSRPHSIDEPASSTSHWFLSVSPSLACPPEPFPFFAHPYVPFLTHEYIHLLTTPPIYYYLLPYIRPRQWFTHDLSPELSWPSLHAELHLLTYIPGLVSGDRPEITFWQDLTGKTSILSTISRNSLQFDYTHRRWIRDKGFLNNDSSRNIPWSWHQTAGN